jgi:hypothetical protein
MAVFMTDDQQTPDDVTSGTLRMALIALMGKPVHYQDRKLLRSTKERPAKVQNMLHA